MGTMMTHEEFIKTYLFRYDIEYELKYDILFIYGGLDFNNYITTMISELPDDLHINGWLDIKTTEITKLPENLYIKSLLFYDYSQISKLPDSISFGKSNLSTPLLGNKLSGSEKLQLKLISQGAGFLNCFITPTKKAISLHKLLWEL